MADKADVLTPFESALLRFLNLPFLVVVPALLASMAAVLYGFSLVAGGGGA